MSKQNNFFRNRFTGTNQFLKIQKSVAVKVEDQSAVYTTFAAGKSASQDS